jgi:predicted RNA-binding Zn ribbon-like protein
MARTTDRAADSLIVPRPGLCLDFANTLAWRGSELAESLRCFPDLLNWCGANELPATEVARFTQWAAAHRTPAAVLFNEALALREAIYRICFAIADSDSPAGHDIDLVNQALLRAPARRILIRSGVLFGWRLDLNGYSAPTLLAPVLWSFGDLMVGSNAGRIRYCANEKCRWLFLDDSRNRSRRWCSMQSCGNRAKAHRHYLKQKKL